MSQELFHLFSNFPYDIRCLIWKAAIRPTGDDIAGIHTFIIGNIHLLGPNDNGSSLKKLPYPGKNKSTSWFAAIPESEDNGRANRSAYLWDAGLWTACKESRRTIMMYFNMSYWHQKRRVLASQALETFEDGAEVDYEAWKEHRNIPVVMSAPLPGKDVGNGKKWHLMVRPYQDAFKLQLNKNTNLRCLRFGYSWGSMNWDRLFAELPYTAHACGGGSLKNFIVEFDQSWNRGLRDVNFLSLVAEMTPRSFFADLIWRIMFEAELDFFVWVIDRGHYQCKQQQQGLHRRRLDTGRPTIFYDCGEEYVDTGLELQHNNETAADFIRKMGQLATNYHGQLIGDDESAVPVDNFMSVLRPRKMASSSGSR